MAEEGAKKESKATTSRDSKSDRNYNDSGCSRSSASLSTDSMEAKRPTEAKNATGPHLGTKEIVKKERKRRAAAGRMGNRKTSRRVKRKPRTKGPRAQIPSISTSSSTSGRSESSPRKIYNVATQAGSRTVVLSPLYIKSNTTDGQRPAPRAHCQITPEMIYESLRSLAKLRPVATAAIFKYIRANYPVNPDSEELMADLIEKLEIAAVSGLIWALPNECWRLTSAIERVNKLQQSHVTIFWKVYADTLKPLHRKRKRSFSTETEMKNLKCTSSQQTEDDSKDLF